MDLMTLEESCGGSAEALGKRSLDNILVGPEQGQAISKLPLGLLWRQPLAVSPSPSLAKDEIRASR